MTVETLQNGVINVKNTYQKPVLDLPATGQKIKTLMKQRGISARQLQLILNFPYVQTIYNWFAGKNMPSIDNLVVLAQILGVSMDDLVVTTIIDVELDFLDVGEKILSA